MAGLPTLFLLSTLACVTLFVAAMNYYFRTRENALMRRIEELQEQASGGTRFPLSGGDFWEWLLRITYGTLLGKEWFRQKELELMRGGIRGPRVVKIYGILSLAFTAALVYHYLRGASLATLNEAANRMGSWVAGQDGATPKRDNRQLERIRSATSSGKDD